MRFQRRMATALSVRGGRMGFRVDRPAASIPWEKGGGSRSSERAPDSLASIRAMHMLGTTLGILGVGAWLTTGRARYLAAGVAGSYGSAWIGHFAFEGNNPAAFENPVWSLEADLRMYRLWLTGDLDAEIKWALGKSENAAG